MNEKKYSLSGTDLIKLTNDMCNIFIYKELIKINDIDELFKNDLPCVILYETSKGYGHWTCLIRINDEIIEHFDPYGYNLDNQIGFIPNSHRSYETSFPHLTELIQNSYYKRVENSNRQLQELAKDINTCGRWIIIRINSWNERRLRLCPFIKIFEAFNQKRKPKWAIEFLKKNRIYSKVKSADDLVTVLTKQ